VELLTGAVRAYHWGDPDWIPRMLGREPDGTPQAELWFGTHPSAPCALAGGGTLAEAVRRDPVGTVGDPAAAGLPFLIKVLAAAGPLSIQVHPDAAQARAGHAREEAAGIAVDAPERTYRDDQPKPELICALTPFSAKCGLKEPDRSAALLDGLAVPAAAPLVQRLAGAGAPAARLRAAVSWLLELDPGDAGALADAVAAAAARAPSGADELELEWTMRLAAAYPGDVGVVLALLLHHVELQPGQAMFLGAGRLHSYLSGVAVEVMAPSDNVVRGGLTSKHVDTAELLRLLDSSPDLPRVQDPVGPDHAYDVPDAAFGLRRLDLDAQAAAGGEPAVIHGPGVLLVTQGRAHLVRAGGGLSAGRGQAVFVRADDGPVAVTGEGAVHVAHAG
jgi:mannose-6-phosphate isomerase